MKKHFIPHPLCGNDPKTIELFLQNLKQEWESIEEYIKHSPNPRWAASHLVRVISRGLSKADYDISHQLAEIANQLSHDRR